MSKINKARTQYNMNDYRALRIDITPCTTDGTDILAYLLAEVGFESFLPDSTGLTAYIRKEDYDPIKVNDALAQYPFAAALDISSEIIEGRDWNAEWEKNYFQPIVIDGQCVVHSTFHENVPAGKFDIIIDPKMAFGTGHHATTSQVLKVLLDTDLTGKTVTDMGTGTAILSILCALKGAASVTGIEIEEFAYTNAIENVRLNGVRDKVSLIHGDASSLLDCPKCDIFIANINRNIIVADLPAYRSNMKDNAIMILSGFYEEDIPHILNAAAPLGLREKEHTTLDRWACLILKVEK